MRIYKNKAFHNNMSLSCQGMITLYFALDAFTAHF